MVGLITGNDETAYGKEVRELEGCCRDNNLSLHVSKTKELTASHAPIHVDGAAVERVVSFTPKSNGPLTVMKKARQGFVPLRKLKTFGIGPSDPPKKFYSGTVESILTGCITAWYGNSTAFDRMALQRAVRTARHITGADP